MTPAEELGASTVRADAERLATREWSAGIGQQRRISRTAMPSIAGFQACSKL